MGENGPQDRTGLSSESSVDTWAFTAQERGVGEWVENYYEEASGVRGDSG